MASTQRALINLEILSDDILSLAHNDLQDDKHLLLLRDFLTSLNGFNALIEHETEASFKTMLQGSSFEGVFEKKGMVKVYIKLLGFVTTAWQASNKAKLIIEDNFESDADKRLELLQTKAIRAKSQLKTVASAMGYRDYQKFLSALALDCPQWQWDTLRARF